MPRVPKLPPTSCMSTRTLSDGTPSIVARSFLQPHRAAVAGIERVAPGRRIECAERGARLHRHAGDALHPGFEARDMRGARKGGLGRRGVAELGVEADIGACVSSHSAARPGRAAATRVGHGGQRARSRLDVLGAVLGRVRRVSATTIATASPTKRALSVGSG